MRRRLLCTLLAGACSMTAVAAESTLPLVSIERQGYAFDFPRVLAQQRLFGIAHGVSLLAAACLDVPAHMEAAGDAYEKWRDQQSAPIDAAEQELAVFYFGSRASEADWAHIVRALNLREKLDLDAEAPELAAACASLPQALQQPRYDLNAMFRLEEALAVTTLAVRAETLAERCLTQLPEAQRAPLTAAFASWQEDNATHAETARVQVRSAWRESGSQGEADAWLEALPQRYAKTGNAACKSLPAWLASPKASLATAFALPPAPVALPASVAEDNAVLPVLPAEPVVPVAAPEPLSVPAQQEASPVQDVVPSEVVHDDPPPTYPSLFDLLMRLFDERPHEADAQSDAGSDAGNTPRARSQRTHP